MTRSRFILISSVALSALAACGGGDTETAGPNLGGESGSAGESGAGGEWGIAGEGGSAGEAGSAGVAGSAGESSGGVGGDAGSAGAAGAGGTDVDAGVEDDAGQAGAGGSGGDGGFGGAGGKGGTSGSGGFSAAGGSSGSGAGGTGGIVVIPAATFVTNLTKNDLAVFHPGGAGTLVGSYTAYYINQGYATAKAATVTKSHVLLSKSGKPTMSYTFTVTPVSSPLLDNGESATVKHTMKMNSGSGTAEPCLYHGGTMMLNVEWLLSSGETRKDSFGPVPVTCSSP